MAIIEAEHDDHALAVDENVVASHWGVLAIGPAAIEDAIQIFWHFAVGDFAIAQVGFEAHGRAGTLVDRNVREANRSYGG